MPGLHRRPSRAQVKLCPDSVNLKARDACVCHSHGERPKSGPFYRSTLQCSQKAGLHGGPAERVSFALRRGWRPWVALVCSGPRGGSPRCTGRHPSGTFRPWYSATLPYHCPLFSVYPSHLSASTQALPSVQLSLS